jgi:peptidyl-prolyl cis-trans isomerase C
MISLLRRPSIQGLALACLTAASLMAAPVFAVEPAAAPAGGTVADFLKQPASKDDPVLARVNGVEIRKSEMLRELKGLPPQVTQLPMAQVYPLLIDRMVGGKLLIAAGKADKLADDKQVKEAVAVAQDQAIERAYLDRAVKAQITDKMLHERYDQALKQNPPQDEVHARHILVATEAEAKDVIAQLDKGANFETLAKSKSSDSSAKDGGDLGFFGHDDMVPEFADVAFKLKAGEYSKTPVKSQFGFHVIKVLEHRQAKAPAFDEVKDQLTQEVSQEIAGKLVEDLKAKAKVEEFGLDGKPMAPPPAKP